MKFTTVVAFFASNALAIHIAQEQSASPNPSIEDVTYAIGNGVCNPSNLNT